MSLVGPVAGLVPMAVLFITLEELNISISWTAEVFVSGFVVGGVAAFVSGRALIASLSGMPVSVGHK